MIFADSSSVVSIVSSGATMLLISLPCSCSFSVSSCRMPHCFLISAERDSSPMMEPVSYTHLTLPTKLEV